MSAPHRRLHRSDDYRDDSPRNDTDPVRNLLVTAFALLALTGCTSGAQAPEPAEATTPTNASTTATTAPRSTTTTTITASATPSQTTAATIDDACSVLSEALESEDRAEALTVATAPVVDTLLGSSPVDLASCYSTNSDGKSAGFMIGYVGGGYASLYSLTYGTLPSGDPGFTDLVSTGDAG